MARPLNARPPHRVVNPESFPRPSGYSYAVAAAPGRQLFLAGQTGHRHDGSLAGEGIVEQFDQACANVVEVLAAAGAAPEHLVQVEIFVTDVEEYRASSKELGEVYRRRLGGHYPAAALLGVTRLFEPGAKVELVGIAVVPDDRHQR